MSSTATVSQYFGMHSKQPWFVLRAAKEFSILPSDDPNISHFYSFEAASTASSTLAIPDGCVDILFDCDDTSPSAYVHGTPVEAMYVDLQEGHRYIGVRFSPGVVPNFLNISAGELIDAKYDFFEVMPNAEWLFEKVVAQQSFAAQVELLSLFLSEHTIPRSSSKLTLPVVNKICQQGGNIRVKELENMTGYTSRTLQRSFKSDMGMSPKAFSRIIRCQSAVYKIHHERVGFSDLAFELGFSDQSHFLREFKRLVSATPLDYQNRVQQQTYVSKIRLC